MSKKSIRGDSPWKKHCCCRYCCWRLSAWSVVAAAPRREPVMQRLLPPVLPNNQVRSLYPKQPECVPRFPAAFFCVMCQTQTDPEKFHGKYDAWSQSKPFSWIFSGLFAFFVVQKEFLLHFFREGFGTIWIQARNPKRGLYYSFTPKIVRSGDGPGIFGVALKNFKLPVHQVSGVRWI